MLSYIKIRNFKSILDLNMDMSYTASRAPNNYKESEKICFLEVNKKNKISMVSPVMLLLSECFWKSNIINVFLYYIKF